MDNVVVCLTSYGYRLRDTAPKAINSLFMGDFRPARVILYVAENDKKMVGNALKTMENEGKLEIRYCKDYLSHKKFLGLTDRTLDNEFIVIVDDDLYFKPYFWQKLREKWEKYKNLDNFIIVNRAQLMFSHEKYLKTRFVMKNDPDMGIFRWGSGAGVLIPPMTMRFDLKTLENGFKISPHCDETYYSCLCVRKGIKMITTGKPQPFYPIPLPKEDPNGLWDKYNQYEKDGILLKNLEFWGINKPNVVVSFTSWRKRIHLAEKVVQMMRKQTIAPKNIILTLSTTEFPRKEADLPLNLVNLVGNGFEIKWVEWDSKTFKKLEPLFYLPEDQWVMIVDDDVDYPDDMIAMMLGSVAEGLPVTASHLRTSYRHFGNILSANGAFTLIQPRHCQPYLAQMWEFCKNKGYSAPCSDPMLTYATLLNGFHFAPSKCDLGRIQRQGDGKYPAPYSGGELGIRRNRETHREIDEFFKENPCLLQKNA